MIDFTKFLLIGTLFAGFAGSAFASPITTSTLDINGTLKLSGSGSSTGLNFTTDPAPATNGTGQLAYFDGSSEVVLSKTFVFSTIKQHGGELLFTMTEGKYTVEFFVTGYTYNANTLTFTGYMSTNGVAGSNATLVDTFGSTSGDNGTSYTGELTLTPEPNSIVLLGTGLLATCGLLTVKRRRALFATI